MTDDLRTMPTGTLFKLYEAIIDELERRLGPEGALAELRKHDPDLDVSSMAELRRRL
jgi:hypothetical protein